MPGIPSPAFHRIAALAIGKSCVVQKSPGGMLSTARKHHPDREFIARQVDRLFVVKRIA